MSLEKPRPISIWATNSPPAPLATWGTGSTDPTHEEPDHVPEAGTPGSHPHPGRGRFPDRRPAQVPSPRGTRCGPVHPDRPAHAWDPGSLRRGPGNPGWRGPAPESASGVRGPGPPGRDRHGPPHHQAADSPGAPLGALHAHEGALLWLFRLSP